MLRSRFAAQMPQQHGRWRDRNMTKKALDGAAGKSSSARQNVKEQCQFDQEAGKGSARKAKDLGKWNGQGETYGADDQKDEGKALVVVGRLEDIGDERMGGPDQHCC